MLDRFNAVQLEIVRKSWPVLLIYISLYSLSYSYVDIYHRDDDALYFLVMCMAVWLNFGLLVGILLRRKMVVRIHPLKLLTYLGLSIVHYISVTLATLFLILPGFYLMLRWLPAFALHLSERRGVIESLVWSWRRTSPHGHVLASVLAWPIAIYLAVLGANFALMFESGFNLEGLSDFRFAAWMILSNFGMSISAAWLTVLGVASFALLRDDAEEIAQIFE